MQQQQTLEEIRAMDDSPTIIFLFIFIIATFLCSLIDPYDNRH